MRGTARLAVGLGQREPGRAHLGDDVLGDGERRREAGGADPADARVALLVVHGDLVVPVLGGGAHARVGRRHLLVQQVGHDPAAGVEEGGEALGRGGGVVGIVDVLGRRAQQHVAVDRRRHQDALRPLRRHREHNRRHERPRQLVEDHELSAPWCDRELVVAEPTVEVVGTQAGRVDHPAGADRACRSCAGARRRRGGPRRSPSCAAGARRRHRPPRWRRRCWCSTGR